MLMRTELLDQAARLRRDAVEAAPGRVADVIDAQVGAQLELPDAPAMPDGLTEAEEVVVDLTEQFLVDVHAISDARFARLGDHYSPGEQIAIMFHLAFADGFAKLSKVHPESSGVVQAMMETRDGGGVSSAPDGDPDQHPTESP